MKKKNKNLSKEKLLTEINRLKSELKKKKRYGLVWEEKPEDVIELCKKKLPILVDVEGKTISTDKDGPIDILIEGDNYHALSVLNYTHAKKIDVIYIDPPYNTGRKKEWKFNDKWVDKNDAYKHSKWLSFVSKRLQLTKTLLKNEGVIFISIDDNEYAQLKLLCDNIFGEKQFVGSLVWEKKKKGSHLDISITNIKEYVLVYTRNKARFLGLTGEIKEDKETYPCLNPGNGYSKRVIPAGTTSTYREPNVSLPKGHVISSGNMRLTLISNLVIKNKVLLKDVVIEAEWRYKQDKLNSFAQKGELYFTQDLYLRRVVSKPRDKKLKDLLLRTGGAIVDNYIDDLVDKYEEQELDTGCIESILQSVKAARETSYFSDINPNNLYLDGWGSNEDGDNEQRDFFGKRIFDYPKPSKLIEKLIAATQIKSGIVLDFFAGSGTTAHSVRKLVKKGRNLQFILCTNNEDNNGNGLKIASDICYLRIKKVIKGYKNRNGKKIAGLGGNLKYFKTAFVDAEPTDKNKKKLTEQATEMLCLKEGTFEKVVSRKTFKIYKNSDHYTGIILNQLAIPDFKKAIEKIKGRFSVYVFSLGDDLFEEEFDDVKQKVKLSPIPEVILRVYRRIFK